MAFFKAKSKWLGFAMDWAAALELPEETRRFVTSFMAGQLFLPMVGQPQVPQYMGMPSMLLFRIGDSPHSHAQKLKESVLAALENGARCLIISGVSGCGKTRSLYDLFCEMDGLYFVLSTELNGGSKDLEHMIDLLNAGTYLRRGHNPPGIKCFPDLDQNRVVVTVLVTLLLACRMKVYDYCKSCPGYDSRKWLLLQTACRGFVDEDGKPLRRDPFYDLFKSASELLQSHDIKDQLEPLRGLLGSMTTIPAIALDEAQIAMKLFSDGYFWSTSRNKYVPLSNALEQALRVDRSLNHLTILAGTGHTLLFQEDLIGAGVAKLTHSARFTSFGSFAGADSMLAYAKQAVTLSEEDERGLKIVHTMFEGRFRPFAAVLELMLAERIGIRAAAARVLAGLSTSTGVAEMKISFYRMIARLGEEPSICRGVNLMEKLETATVQYFCTGRGFTLMENQEACIALVEAGIGRLVNNGHKYSMRLEEHLMLAAARNYFEDRHEEKGHRRSSYLPSKWLEMSNRVPYPSAQGLCLQNLYALSFQSMWEKYDGVMNRMPLVKPLLELDNCPKEFKYLATLAGVLVKGMRDVFVSTGSYAYQDFLWDMENGLFDMENGEHICTTLVSGGNEATADSLCGIRYVDAQGEPMLLHVLEQDKFQKNPLTSAQMFDGLVKTGFPEDSTEYGMLSNIQLRLLVVAPQSTPEDHPRYFWETHANDKAMGFIVIDAENVAELLGGDEEAATLLAAMKADVSSRMKRKMSISHKASVKRFLLDS